MGNVVQKISHGNRIPKLNDAIFIPIDVANARLTVVGNISRIDNASEIMAKVSEMNRNRS